MRDLKTLIFYGIVAVLMTDSIGSLASRAFDFDYESLIFLTSSIYGMMGFFAYKISNKIWSSIFSGAIIGLCDSTVGWWLSVVLEANIEDNELPSDVFTYVVVIIMVVMIASFFAGVGGFISKMLIGKKG